ncbi:MAG: acyltransferase family protein [Opitutaceae bacterium]
MNQNTNNSYRPEIDGLRALAVVPVVLYHLGIAMPGGYVGVDIFFVISGYLITGIILKELDQGNFSMLTFYERRVRRILPAFTFMMFGVLLAAWYLFLPYEMEQLGKHLTEVSIFLSNFWLKARAGDYWSPGVENFPLLHTWSLAVEEQYYLFIPPLMILLFRWQRNHIKHWMWFGFIVSLTYCIFTTPHQPAAAFYLLPARSWELIMGSLLYLYSNNPGATVKRKTTSQSFALIGLSMVIISFFTLNSETQFPGYAALLPTFGAALIIYTNRSKLNGVGKLLALTPLRAIGLISYSLYLWHWPLIVFFKAYRYPAHLTKIDQVIILVLSIALAVFSWKFVEQPFRTRNKDKSPWVSNLVGGSLLIFMVGVSLVIRKMDGYPQRFEGRGSQELYNIVKSNAIDFRSNDFQAKKLFLDGGIQHNVSDQAPPEWVVIGDSHATMFAPVIADIAKEQNTPIAFFTQNAYNILTRSSPKEYDAVTGNLLNWHPSHTFIILHWGGLFASNDEKVKHQLIKWLKFASLHSDHLHVALQVPLIAEEDLRSEKILYNRTRLNDGKLPQIKEPDSSRLSRKETVDFLLNLKLGNLTIHDLSQPFLHDSHVIYHTDGHLFYRDEDHLNLLGAMQVQELLRSSIQSLNVQIPINNQKATLGNDNLND